MNCESCFNEHDGTFGSGRFCSRSCSNRSSTQKTRKEINEKVSKTLRKGFLCKGCGNRFFREQGKRASRRCKDCQTNNPYPKTFEEVSMGGKRRRLIDERGHRCESCSLEIWLEQKIPLQVDHVDGNPDNNEKSNLKLLCANCHMLTPTWGSRNKGKFPNSIRKKNKLPA